MKNKKKKNTYCFPAILTYKEGQEIAVEFPDLDVATSGVDDKDALISARELLGIAIFGLEEDDQKIPEASSLQNIVLEADQKAILVDVYMPAVRMAQNNRSVNRTVTLPAWLNAKAQELNINFSQVLQEALKEQIQLKSI